MRRNGWLLAFSAVALIFVYTFVLEGTILRNVSVERQNIIFHHPDGSANHSIYEQMGLTLNATTIDSTGTASSSIVDKRDKRLIGNDLVIKDILTDTTSRIVNTTDEVLFTKFEEATQEFFNSLKDDEVRNATKWIHDYCIWHNEQRRKYPDTQLLLSKDPNAPKLAIVYMDPKRGGGLTDRMKGIGHLMKRCYEDQRVILLKWHDDPLPLESFLIPHLFNWTVPNHPSVEFPDRLKALYGPDALATATTANATNSANKTFFSEFMTSAAIDQRVKLYLFTNQLGNYLHPFGIIWHAYFVPSPLVQKMIDETSSSLGLQTGPYDAIHCRLGHPAYANKKKSYNVQIDQGKGYNFEGINRAKALSTAIHAISCSQWLANNHFSQNVQEGGSRTTQNDGAAEQQEIAPIFFYSDSEDLNRAVLQPTKFKTKNVAHQELLSILSNTTANLVGRSRIPISHIQSIKTEAGSQNNSDAAIVEGFANTFVDLYIASNARCISMGVGRFAYMAAKISGTTCWNRHQTPHKDVASHWGMTLMNREVPECPIPNEIVV